MADPPEPLDYARPTVSRASSGTPGWSERIDAVLRMCGGIMFLVIGIANLLVLLFRRGQEWLANGFLAFAGLAAGYVFTVRPLCQMIRGRDWWTLK